MPYTGNKITIIGHTGSLPEPKFHQGGSKSIRVSVAESHYRGAGKEEPTQWWSCVGWDKVADGIERKARKTGAYVLVEGRVRRYTYERDGVTKNGEEIVVSRFLLLENIPNAAGAGEDEDDGDSAAVGAPHVDDEFAQV